jgi:uncharacterized OsmC-like protein
MSGRNAQIWKSFCRNADRLLFRQLLIASQGECHMSQATMNGIVNGVDVDRMTATIEAVQGNRALAEFQFRASNRWVNGGHNRSTIHTFYGAGQEHQLGTRPFILDADEPPVLLGNDHGANPVEYVLHALAACLTTSLVYHAAARGIRVESVESKLEGDLDLQGFLGISDQVRRGYKQIRATLVVKSDATADQLEALTRFSPVHDIVTNPVPVTIAVQSL